MIGETGIRKRGDGDHELAQRTTKYSLISVTTCHTVVHDLLEASRAVYCGSDYCDVLHLEFHSLPCIGTLLISGDINIVKQPAQYSRSAQALQITFMRTRTHPCLFVAPADP